KNHGKIEVFWLFGLVGGFSHTVEVTGSNPVPPTRRKSLSERLLTRTCLRRTVRLETLECAEFFRGRVTTACPHNTVSPGTARTTRAARLSGGVSIALLVAPTHSSQGELLGGVPGLGLTLGSI